MESIPASSTMTVAPGPSRYSSSGGRSVRCHSWSSLATVSERIPVSRSRLRAALAVGANPNTCRPWSCRSLPAAVSMRVLPAPAGPTTNTSRSSPATDGRRLALHHVETGPVDRRRRRRRVGLGCHRPGDDVLLLGQHRLGRVPGRGRFDPHRPAIRLAPRRVARRVEIDEVLEHQVGGAFDGIEPAVSRHLRHGTLTVTDRLDHIGPTPRRPLRRHRLHDIVDRQHVDRTRGGGRPARWRRRAGRRSSRLRRLRSATVSPDRRHRGRTCASGCPPMLPAPGRRVRTVTAPGLRVGGTRRAWRPWRH